MAKVDYIITTGHDQRLKQQLAMVKFETTACNSQV